MRHLALTFLLFSAACSSSGTGGGIAPLIDVEWRVIGLTGVDGVIGKSVQQKRHWSSVLLCR